MFMETFISLVESELNELEQLIEVAVKRARVIRKGKLIRKKKCAPGYRLIGNRCVRQSSRERQKRKRGAIRGNRLGKSARKRSFKRSIRKRRRYFR